MEADVHGGPRRPEWRDLLARGGSATTLLLAVAATTLRDLEAAAFTIGAMIALALLRFRTGLIGVVGLALLSADVALWMGPGAYSNLVHGEGLWETALPAALTVAAVTTLAGALLDLRERRTHTTSGRAPQIAQMIAAGFAALALAVPALGLGRSTGPQPGDLEIVTEDVRFRPGTLRADTGRNAVSVSNGDLFWHTFTVRELNLNVSVPVGGQRRAAFDAPAGTYRFICAIPGHEQAGMKGTLVVR